MHIFSSFSEFVILEDFFGGFWRSVFDKRKYLLGKLHKIICKCIKLSKIKTETIAVAFVKIIRAFLKKKPLHSKFLFSLYFCSFLLQPLFFVFTYFLWRFWYLFSFKKLQTNTFNIKILEKASVNNVYPLSWIISTVHHI